MRITKIFIQNFRKLHRCVIDLGEQKTLFVGANNSGKTSVLASLYEELQRFYELPLSLTIWTAQAKAFCGHFG